MPASLISNLSSNLRSEDPLSITSNIVIPGLSIQPTEFLDVSRNQNSTFNLNKVKRERIDHDQEGDYHMTLKKDRSGV